MIDARSGRVLYEKNADQRRPVASTQKLMTALLALEKGSMDEAIRIEPADTMVEPSKLGLKSGEVYSKNKLLGAIMVKSSNDAAAALGRNHSGSTSEFARAMTVRARELGAYDSVFMNAHGLPAPGQFSTARDIARIAFRANRHPVIRQYARMRYYPFTFASGRTVRLETTNKLLARSPSFTGLKTGYTNASGRCLVTTARVGGTEVIIVQLGSTTRRIFDDAERLAGWGGGNASWMAMR
jgi:serine-type D-Ala-D-Ala carboxypeptidase (penicillin-binding protein 5/6)